ncbi:hypothetical protein QGP82_21075 [Leptothoe sp. LEGE 181152]|nr:hypothetical protein [Leptothoe sp. LEGE 181152]
MPSTDSAADLLIASELYLDSDDGMVPANRYLLSCVHVGLPASPLPHAYLPTPLANDSLCPASLLGRYATVARHRRAAYRTWSTHPTIL